MPKKQTIRVKARKPVYRVPPRVEYALSPPGETPGPILDAMATWGTEYRTSDGGGTTWQAVRNSETIFSAGARG